MKVVPTRSTASLSGTLAKRTKANAKTKFCQRADHIQVTVVPHAQEL